MDGDDDDGPVHDPGGGGLVPAGINRLAAAAAVRLPDDLWGLLGTMPEVLYRAHRPAEVYRRRVRRRQRAAHASGVREPRRRAAGKARAEADGSSSDVATTDAAQDLPAYAGGGPGGGGNTAGGAPDGDE